jgi:hypothetical protein
VIARLIAIGLASLAVACGGSKPADPPAAAATPPPAAPAAPAAAKAAPRTAPRTAEAVGFEQLVPVLAEVEGWTRSTPRGEQVTAGVPMSRASARYEQGEAIVDVEILDSAFHELVLAPVSAYLTAGFAERMTHGYRKAAAINGQPGFEEWNGSTRRAQVTVVVADRFIVNATGRNVDNADAPRAIVQKLGLANLATLK